MISGHMFINLHTYLGFYTKDMLTENCLVIFFLQKIVLGTIELYQEK